MSTKKNGNLIAVSFVTLIDSIWCGRRDLELRLLRTEMATRGAIGNKHYKLMDNLAYLHKNGCKSILSFGGAWSNHLQALSFEARRIGMEAVGIVRGDAGADNQLLRSVRQNGMRVEMISRDEYRQRHDPVYCQQLCQQHNCDTWLPEGGANKRAVEGCRRILQLCEGSNYTPDIIALAVGTGATMAGVIRSATPSQSVIGFPVVRDDSVAAKIKDWIDCGIQPVGEWRLAETIKPRYATVNAELIRFILTLYCETGVVLDPVYTGKTLHHLMSPEFATQLPENSKVLFIHTGGLVGAFGFSREFYQWGEAPLVDRYFAEVERLTAEVVQV